MHDLLRWRNPVTRLSTHERQRSKAAAARQRRYRERRRRGDLIFLMQLTKQDIASLVKLGCLDEADQSDRAAVVSAFSGFCGKAFDRVRRADDAQS
jgi:hypothetical protein